MSQRVFLHGKPGRLMCVVLQGDGKGQARSKSPQDVVRELYAGVDLPKLVQRMLVVMHEVNLR